MTIVSKPASAEYRSNWDATFAPDEVGVVYHDQVPREYQVPLTVPEPEAGKEKPLVKVTEWRGFVVGGGYDELMIQIEPPVTDKWLTPLGRILPDTRLGRYRVTVEFWPEDPGK